MVLAVDDPKIPAIFPHASSLQVVTRLGRHFSAGNNIKSNGATVRILVLALDPLPRSFSQVFILKGVKVIYFDTLLQVLILKVDRALLDRRAAGARGSAEVPHTPGVLQKESASS